MFKKWVEGCEQCARDKHVPNATITPELRNLPEWDLEHEDAMQIDLLPNLPPSGGCENVPNFNWCLRSLSVRLSSYGRFSNQYSKSAHSYNDETCVFTNNTHYWQRNCIHFYDYCGDYANFGNHSHMCNNSTSANNREIGTNTCFTEDESKNGMWGMSPTMA